MSISDEFNVDDFAGLIQKYDFVEYIEKNIQNKFFKSFGPNWAYHIYSAIDSDELSEIIMIDTDSDPTTEEVNGIIARVFTSLVDNFCEGAGIYNEEVLTALYIWRPDLRINQLKKKHPRMENPERYVELTHEMPNSHIQNKTFDERVFAWKEAAKRTIADARFKHFECVNCSDAPPVSPLRSTKPGWEPPTVVLPHYLFFLTAEEPYQVWCEYCACEYTFKLGL